MSTQTSTTIRRTCDSYTAAVDKLLDIFGATCVDVRSGSWRGNLPDDLNIHHRKADIPLGVATHVRGTYKSTTGICGRPEILPGQRGFESREWARLTLYVRVPYEHWQHEFGRSAIHDEDGQLLERAQPAKDTGTVLSVTAELCSFNFSLVGWEDQRDQFLADELPGIPEELAQEVQQHIVSFNSSHDAWQKAVCKQLEQLGAAQMEVS